MVWRAQHFVRPWGVDSEGESGMVHEPISQSYALQGYYKGIWA